MKTPLRHLFTVAVVAIALALFFSLAEARGQDSGGDRLFDGGTIESGTYQAPGRITARNTTVASGSEVTFRAGESIHLEAGFEAEAGSHFVAEIGEPKIARCGQPATTASPPPTSDAAAQIANIRMQRARMQRARNDTIALKIQVDVINLYEDNPFNDVGRVSRSAIETQIDSLNRAFSSLFRFELGYINRVPDSTAFHSPLWRPNSSGRVELTPVGERIYKQETQDRDRRINLILTGNPGINNQGNNLLGISSIPGGYSDPTNFHHAVTIDYRTVPGIAGLPRFSEGNTAVHEIGHFLGLYHTFKEPGICDIDNDEVSDTNNEEDPAVGSLAMVQGNSSCGSPDPVYNYMNYSDDPVLREFTGRQAARIVERLALAKDDLGDWLIQDPGGGENGYRVGNGDLLPNPINSDLYIEGVWTVDENEEGPFDEGEWVIENNATLNVLSGTTIQMNGSDAEIVAVRGGRIVAQGTPGDWVQFDFEGSGDTPDLGGSILLEAPGNRFEYTIFDGGGPSLAVGSRDNEIRYSIFRNSPGPGLVTNSARDPFGRSELLLENSLIEHNAASGNYNGSGAVLNYVNATVKNTTIRNHGLEKSEPYSSDGLEVESGTVELFRSVVSNNSGIGVNVHSGGGVDTGHYLLNSNEEGLMRVANNGSHEIFIGQNSSIWLGYIHSYGYNAIYDANDGDDYLIYYDVGDRLWADGNYWGGTPQESDFYGRVRYPDYDYEVVRYADYLSNDPTGDAGAPSHVLQQGTTQQVASVQENMSQTSSSVNSETTPTQPDVRSSPERAQNKLRRLMSELRRKMKENPASQRSSRWIRKLHALQAQDRENRLGDKQINMAAIRRFQGRLGNAFLHEAVQDAGEVAVLVTVLDAMREENYEKAQSLIDEYGTRFEGRDNRRALVREQLSIFEIKRDFQKALSALGQLRAIGSGEATRETGKSSSRLLNQIERRLREKLGDAEAAEAALAKGAASAEPGALRNARSAKPSERLPEAFGLGGAYPNPTSSRMSLPLDLPKKAQVSATVYDVLGRRVRFLLEGRTFTAGRHTLEVDAGSLASGLYLIRVRVEATASGDPRIFTEEFTVVR